MTNKNNGQRDTRAIIILSVIVTLLVGVLVASICMQGFTELDPFGLFDKKEDPSLPGGGGGMVVDPDDPSANMMKLSVAPSSAVASSSSEENTKVLTATVEPAEAPQEVDWAIAFVNPASTWASGKTVTDYVTITPESDGSKTATVKCLQAFGEQIKVTASARSDASKNATCTVDFVKDLSIEYNSKYKSITKVNNQSPNLFTFKSGDVGTIDIDSVTVSTNIKEYIQHIINGFPIGSSYYDKYNKVLSYPYSYDTSGLFDGYYMVLSQTGDEFLICDTNDQKASEISGNVWFENFKNCFTSERLGNPEIYNASGSKLASRVNKWLGVFHSLYLGNGIYFNFEIKAKSYTKTISFYLRFNSTQIVTEYVYISSVAVDPDNTIFGS